MPSTPLRRAPRLSVVVPVYQVEQYLGRCLDSLVGQSFAGIEVVVVDDGSTDRSHEIACSYAARDARVRVIRTENRGLGAARNRGAREACGEYLAFVDSDDWVTRESYAPIIEVLDSSGSDFAVASGRFVDDTGEAADMPRLKVVHARRRLGITIDDFPEIMIDSYAVTKVFRRSFYDASDLQFTEGVVYEDQPPIIRAYLRAQAFDVLKREFYRVRRRGDGSSIMQNRVGVADLRDRILTKQMVVDDMLVDASPRVRDAWFTQTMAADLRRYLLQVPGCDDDYWEMLHTGFDRLWSHGWGLGDTCVPPWQRLAGWLLQEGRRGDVARVVEYAVSVGERPDVIGTPHGPMADLPLRGEPGIPEQLFWPVPRFLARRQHP